MIHSSADWPPGMRAITLWSVLRSQLNDNLSRTFDGPGPTWYVIGSAPRHAAGATGPANAASSGCASPYEIGITGIFVNVTASLRSRRFASLVAPTLGVSGSPG